MKQPKPQRRQCRRINCLACLSGKGTAKSDYEGGICIADRSCKGRWIKPKKKKIK